MKKIYSILLSAAVLFSSNIASAQQLPNVGFESWKTASGSTEAFGTGMMSSPKTGEMRVRPGVEPADWNGSSVNQKVLNQVKEQELVFNETSDVALGSSAVKMQNIFIGVGSIGSTAPGFLTFGTPWVYAETNVKNCDGGIYGGVSFEYKPDAISGKYKRTDSNDENSYIIAYLWNGTYSSKVGKKGSPKQSRNDEVRAILGKVTPDASGQLVAKCEYVFKSTNSAWQEITVPFEYVAGAGAPTKMNVIISGGNYWDRGSLKENTTLLADDVKFVYYSRLSALSVNGVSVEGFASDVYNYSIASTELPTEDQISATVMGQTATKSVAIDAEAATVTITVANVAEDIDGKSSHTYVLQYEKAGEEKVGISTEYPGYLNGVIIDTETNENMPFAENEEKEITITEYEDGTCDFLLPDLYLSMLEMSLGDILVEGATVTKDETGVATYNGYVEGMPLLGGDLIADVTLNGTISAAGVVEMQIDVLWEGVPIVCTFTTNQVTGVENIIIENQGNVEYYNLQGVKVANPENGVFIRVQGGKATKVAM